MDTLRELAQWISAHAHQSDPLPTWATLLITTTFAAATIGSAWRLTQLPATLIHELGHAYIARLTGRAVNGIQLHLDTSGVTHSTGKPYGIGYALTLMAGYTAPPLLGAACTWAALNGWSGIALMTLTLILAPTVLLSRNLVALAATTATSALLIFALLHANATLSTAIAQTIGAYLGVAGVRGVIALLEAHRAGRGEGSDAHQLRSVTYLPISLWLTVFTTVACAAATWQVVTILGV